MCCRHGDPGFRQRLWREVATQVSRHFWRKKNLARSRVEPSRLTLLGDNLSASTSGADSRWHTASSEESLFPTRADKIMEKETIHVGTIVRTSKTQDIWDDQLHCFLQTRDAFLKSGFMPARLGITGGNVRTLLLVVVWLFFFFFFCSFFNSSVLSFQCCWFWMFLFSLVCICEKCWYSQCLLFSYIKLFL